jgi:hypothetical protein
LLSDRGFLLDRRVRPNDNGASLSTISASTEKGVVAFTTTHWGVVLEAQGESPAAQEALENLCRTYWRPIYAFVRREGTNPEEAKDITQGFFALTLQRKDFQTVRQENIHGGRHDDGVTSAETPGSKDAWRRCLAPYHRQ